MTKSHPLWDAQAASPIPIALKYLPALVLLWVCVTGEAQNSLQNGLVACYAFSGNASDGSGNYHNGTPNGPSLTTDRFGNANSAYHFDGVNDYITLPENALRTSNYTYSFWAKVASLPALLESYAVLSVGGPGADQGVTLSHGYVGGSTGWSMVSYNADGSNLPSNSVGSLPATGTWHHVVQTRSNTSVDLYVNGALVGSRATGGATVGYNSNTPGATIGCRTNLIQFFHGAIDDVRIYNRAVTSAEATALFQTNSVCQPVNLQAGLIGCYPFSGNGNDAGGSGNNGTVNGPVLTTDRFGNANSAYAFDGINDYIELSPAPFLSNNFTYSAWVKLLANPGSGSAYIFFSVGGVNADQNLSLNNFNAASAMGWTVGGSNTDGSAQHYSTGSLPAPNAWTHLTMTRDNDIVRLFVHGQPVGSASTYGLLPLYNTGAARAVIGARSHDLNQYTKGTIDDVAIYNRALSAAEVNALFNASSCQAPPATVPVAAGAAAAATAPSR